MESTDDSHKTKSVNIVRQSLGRLVRARRPTVVKLCLFATCLSGALTLWNFYTEGGIMTSLQSFQASVLNFTGNETSAGSQKHTEPLKYFQKKEIRRKDGESCKIKTGATTFSSCPQCFRPNTHLVAKVIKSVNTSSFTVPSEHQHIFKPRNKIKQSLVTKYLITPSQKFLDDCPYLLAVQPSVADLQNERHVIRNTWASVAKNKTWPFRRVNADVKILFVLAEKDTTQNNCEASKKILKKVLEEVAEHDDILYLDMIDSYQNLTLKLLSAFKWVTDYCPCSKFVLKVDTDTFVNVPLLVDTLLYVEEKLNFSIAGTVMRSKVHRTGKWGVAKELYPLSNYPYYTAGCGYIISMNALTELIKIAPYIALFSIEDAFITGLLRTVAGCNIFRVGGQMFTHFHEWGKWENCCMYTDQKILGSRVTSKRHNAVWKLYTNGGKGCNTTC